MRFERRPLQTGIPPLGVVLGIVAVLATVVTGVWLRLNLPSPVCNFREWTGRPCPTCGSMRLAGALMRGDIVEAMAWNPLVFLGLCAVIVWAVISALLRGLRLPGVRVVLRPQERKLLWIAVTSAALANWIYLAWRGT
jgi:hypothetical protein